MPSTSNEVASSGSDPMTMSRLHEDAVDPVDRLLRLGRRFDREDVVVFVLEVASLVRPQTGECSRHGRRLQTDGRDVDEIHGVAHGAPILLLPDGPTDYRSGAVVVARIRPNPPTAGFRVASQDQTWRPTCEPDATQTAGRRFDQALSGLEAGEAGPVPKLLVAVTVQVYVLPGVSPRTVTGLVLAEPAFFVPWFVDEQVAV